LFTTCVGTAFYNTLLKERQTGWKDEKEDVLAYLKEERK
jgi:hypothetical protein